jgi:hypothetical protein
MMINTQFWFTARQFHVIYPFNFIWAVKNIYVIGKKKQCKINVCISYFKKDVKQ